MSEGVGFWLPPASGGGGGSSLFDLIYEEFKANTDPIDVLITQGDYRVFVYMGSHDSATWASPTNAILTVPTGKTWLFLGSIVSSGLRSDSVSRKMRLRNTTLGTNLFLSDGNSMPLLLPWAGDLTTPSGFTNSAAAGETLELQRWSIDANKRAMGVVILGVLV